MSHSPINAYLLSRQWRDKPDGIEISFWANSELGPLRLTFPQQKAVCFIDRNEPIDLPSSIERKSVQLISTAGNSVDALYFDAQRDLADWHRSTQYRGLLHESDLKPPDRFLMERFVTAGVIVDGETHQRSGYLEIIKPQLKPCEYFPALSVASIDIETRGLSQQLYSIAVHCGDSSVVLMIGDDVAKDNIEFKLHFFTDELQLMQAFFVLLKQLDPDILIGWNIVGFDLDFLQRKCVELNIPFAMGRGEDASAILAVGDTNQIKIARVPGRAVLDGVDMLRAAFWSFESFSLENVSQELLGRGKVINTNEDKVTEINRLFHGDKVALARYNIEDCKLVTEIFTKANLIEFAMQRAQMTGLPMDKIGGAVQTFDNLYLPRLHRKGYVAAITTEGLSHGSPGGYVLDSKPGLYNNVLVLDFKSLYPSIIRSFLIDPLGLVVAEDDPVPGYDGASFSREQHLLPELVKELWQKRDLAKARNDQPLSQAIKIIMNSLYGVLGTTGCRFHNASLVSSITRRGHEIILHSQSFIEAQGLEVIYGDTDSLFVLVSKDQSTEKARRIGESLQTKLNDYWSNKLTTEYKLESYLEVEFETLYKRFVMPTVRGAQGQSLTNSGSKKRYAGLVIDEHGQEELVFKGLEAVRTDWTAMAREFQRELYARVFAEQPVENLIRNTTEDLISGRLDEKLIYRKRLRRKLSDYQKNVPPHVQAARKSSVSGRWIEYVQTQQGPEPAAERVSEFDYQHYVDKQLAPVADGILHFLNTSYHSVVSQQKELF